MAVRPTDPEALHLYQLIGAPLLSVVQAEAQAAQVSAEFIKTIGFRTPAPADGSEGAPADGGTPGASAPRTLQDGGELGELRMAQFRIDRVGVDGKLQPHVAQLPVLSMFPIPLLQVKHADFEFDIRVLSRVPLEGPRDEAPVVDPSKPKDAKDVSHRAPPSRDFMSKDRVELKGFLASSRGGNDGRASMESSIKVKVRMEQSDLPAGLIHLMKIMADNVSVAPLVLVEQEKQPRTNP